MVISNNKLSKSDFTKLSSFIHHNFGIRLPEIKKTMLECRLQKRMNALKFPSLKDYCEYIFTHEGQSKELVHMIDVVTTNKTDFFREPGHFDYLSSGYLPYIQDSGKPLKIWSAGCSSGEEPYTIAMVIHEYDATINYEITGTDISTEILAKAETGVYQAERVSAIPMEIRRKYFLKSKDALKKTVRVVPELRRKVRFERLNFMDESYAIPTSFDIVFCRNVLIYFDKATQERVITKLCSKLNPGGVFFLGHSESITDMDVPLQQIHPTIFRRI